MQIKAGVIARYAQINNALQINLNLTRFGLKAR